MSDMNYSAIAASLATIFSNKVANQINRSTVITQLFPVVTGDSHNINWVASFGSATGKVIADGAVVDRTNDPQKDDKVPASLNYGTYSETFGVTGRALAGALASGNPSELKNLFASEIKDASERFAKRVEIDLFTGAGVNDAFVGMNASAGALRATGTYANIDRAVRTQWAATEMANGGVGRALTLSLMRDMRRRIYIASGSKPDLIVTTPELHMKYGELIGQQRRWMQDVHLRGQKVTLDGGYQYLEFDGIPVIEAVDAVTGTMDFVSSSSMEIVTQPDPINMINQSMGPIEVKGTAEEQFGDPGARIRARINPLGRDGDRYQFQLLAYLGFRCKRPNTGGIISDLNYQL